MTARAHERTRAPRTGRVRRRVGIALGVSFVAIVFAVPLWSFFVSAFDAAASSRLRLWPEELSLSNFARSFSEGFLHNLGLSVLVAVLSVAIGLAVASTAAFAFVYYRSRLTTALFALVVVSFLLPFEALSVPLVLVFSQLELTDTVAALVVPGIANGLAIFAVTVAYRAIPKEVVEAARMDGASPWRIYRSIYLPLGAPSLVGAGILIFASQWNAYLWPLMVASSDEMKTAAVVLAENSGLRTTDYGGMYAEVLMLSLIPAVTLFLAQRRLGSTFLTSGQK